MGLSSVSVSVHTVGNKTLFSLLYFRGFLMMTDLYPEQISSCNVCEHAFYIHTVYDGTNSSPGQFYFSGGQFTTGNNAFYPACMNVCQQKSMRFETATKMLSDHVVRYTAFNNLLLLCCSINNKLIISNLCLLGIEENQALYKETWLVKK